MHVNIKKTFKIFTKNTNIYKKLLRNYLFKIFTKKPQIFTRNYSYI